MLVKTFASAVHGIDATTITIETEISQGIKFFMVGLPDSAVKESQQRIESAMRLNDFKWPRKKVVINMAPADIRKEGSAYDLPLAIGILAANEQIKSDKIFSETYEIFISQPIDHNNPDGPKFKEQIFLSHIDKDKPMVAASAVAYRCRVMPYSNNAPIPTLQIPPSSPYAAPSRSTTVLVCSLLAPIAR